MRKLKSLYTDIYGNDVYQRLDRNRAPREFIYIDGKPVWYHHYLVEKHFRLLEQGEIVHHIDGNPLNNNIGNLQIMTRRDHTRLHTPVKGYKFTDEQRQNLSKSHLGQVAWNKGKTGFKHSDIAKENMRKAQMGRVITWGDKISASKASVTRDQVLGYLRGNPDATEVQVAAAFGLKSRSFIYKYGGLKALKLESKGVNDD